MSTSVLINRSNRTYHFSVDGEEVALMPNQTISLAHKVSCELANAYPNDLKVVTIVDASGSSKKKPKNPKNPKETEETEETEILVNE